MNALYVAACQYAGLGFLLGALLITAVIVLCERRDHSLDVDELDGTPIRPYCNNPTIRKDHR